MNLKEYINIADNTTKIAICYNNWKILSNYNSISEETAREVFMSYSALNGMLPEFEKTKIIEQLNILSYLNKIIDDPLLQKFFNHFVSQRLEHLKLNSSPEERLADLLYKHFNNNLSENFINQHYVKVENPEHPILNRAKQILDMALIDSSCFINFVEIFKDNKNIFLNEICTEVILEHDSKNKLTNETLVKWNNLHQTDQILNAKSISYTQEKFLTHLYDDVKTIKQKIVEYFILFPEQYAQYSYKALPPAFLFFESSEEQDYNLQLEQKHIEIFMTHAHNTRYDHFVRRLFQPYNKDMDTQTYLSQLFKKDIPFNEILSNTKHLTIFVGDNLCEKYLEHIFSHHRGLQDIHLEFRKSQLEKELNKKILTNTDNKFKL